jgi:hypothetical protein
MTPRLLINCCPRNRPGKGATPIYIYIYICKLETPSSKTTIIDGATVTCRMAHLFPSEAALIRGNLFFFQNPATKITTHMRYYY